MPDGASVVLTAGPLEDSAFVSDRYRVPEDHCEPGLKFVLQYRNRGNVQLLCEYLHIMFIPHPE